jgi:ribonuclease P protein component
MPTVVQGSEVAAARPQLWCISDRRTFQELRRQGHRIRRGPLTVTWLPPAPGAPATPPRAGFAIGKGTGGAVVRNRMRRRLRAALRARLAEGRLPPGTYLLGGTADLATMPWLALLGLLDDALTEVQAR